MTVKASDASRNDMERIGELMLDGTDGKVPLSYVADIVSTSGPNAIGRENAQRLIVVSANVADRDLRSVVNEIGETIRTPSAPCRKDIMWNTADSSRANRRPHAR